MKDMIQVCLRPTMASWSLNVDLAEVRLFMKKMPPNTATASQYPHQSGVLKIDSVRGRGRLVEAEKTNTHQDGRQQLDAADADIAASRVQAKRPALHAVGIE